MFAVVETGGKQYKAEVGTTIKVEKLEGNPGDTITLGKVLVLSDGKTIKLGDSAEGANVSAEILEQKKDKKVVIFKKKRRQNYRRLKGHRQEITVVRVTDISVDGKSAPKKAAPKKDEPKVAAEEKAAPAKKAPAKKATAAKTTTKKTDKE